MKAHPSHLLLKKKKKEREREKEKALMVSKWWETGGPINHHEMLYYEVSSSLLDII